MKQKSYIGIAFGPILQTLGQADKTRELWTASYLFAYLSNRIARAIHTTYPDLTWYKPALGTVAKDSFKLPTNQDNTILGETGVGIFPDHHIFDAPPEKNALEIIRQLVDTVLEEIIGFITQNEADQTYLRRYLQVHIISVELPETSDDPQESNPILQVTDRLSQAELFQKLPDRHSSVLKNLLGKTGKNFLTIAAFHDAEKEIRSIPEIALADVLRDKTLAKKIRKSIYSQDVDRTLLDTQKYLKKEGKSFLTGHKYIAIVHGDGDSIGKTLGQLQRDQWEDFSEALSQFSIEAARMVQEDFSGLPVYFGGDDALFFAPVIYKGQTIFHLLRNMDKAFQKIMKPYVEDGNKPPTLSFGLSITYAKYPLYETLQRSLNLLLGPAKTGVGGKKNNLAFALLKNSGSIFGGTLHLDREEEFSLWDPFVKLFDFYQKNDGTALRSIIYDMPANRGLYAAIATDSVRLKNYLTNSFDEDLHRQESIQDYFREVALIIHRIYTHWEKFPRLTDYLKPDERREKPPEGQKWTRIQREIIPYRIAYGLLKTILFLTTQELVPKKKLTYEV